MNKYINEWTKKINYKCCIFFVVVLFEKVILTLLILQKCQKNKNKKTVDNFLIVKFCLCWQSEI